MPQLPSFGPLVTTTPKRIRLSNWGRELDTTVLLASTARDPNSPLRTTILRAGLVLGRITASGKYAQYNDGASDGTQTAVGLLLSDVDLLDASAVAQDVPAVIMQAGEFDEASIPASGANYSGIDANGKTDLGARCVFRSSTSVP